MGFLSVKVEYNQAAKDFPQIAKRLPSLTAQALNQTANAARKIAVAQTASELNVSATLLNKRFTRGGAAKSKRTWLSVRATPWKLWAELSVYSRGIPLFQLPKRRGNVEIARRTKPGQPVFRVPTGRYGGMVFQRLRPQPTTRQGRRNEGSGALEVPRLGIRDKLRRRFDQNVTGADGRRLFMRFYTEQIRKALAKYGVRA